MNNHIKHYIITVIAVLAVTHGYIVANDSEINLIALLMLAGVAIYSSVFQARKKKELNKVAYLPYMLHVTTYLLVNLSFLAHGFASAIQNADANNGDLILSPEWIGLTVAMPLFWGIGLLVHTVGAYFTRGFENVSIK